MTSGKLSGKPAMMADARGRAMKNGGAIMKAKGKKMQGKKAYSGNRKSAQGSASKRADGIAQRGRTRGKIV